MFLEYTRLTFNALNIICSVGYIHGVPKKTLTFFYFAVIFLQTLTDFRNI